ncbi:glycerophosphodiester phosphodiesterase [Streptococcus caballi]|uniref:glycerophosphodiester phosphodiesterase n=1 Tax=Streptococcus caballi TaxID=439220 RepID=UPI0003782B9A|nr:glycerophosphodiester phosphodiesterase [Streptococcus caballi]
MSRLRKDLGQIYYNLDKLLLLFAVIFVALDLIWPPINSWLSERLLAMTGYFYLSYTNALQVFLNNWWVGILLILLFLLNIGIAYAQIILIITGMRALLKDKPQSLKQYVQTVRHDFKAVLVRTRPSKVLFTLLYLVVLFPYLRRVFNIYFLNKFLIPQFILDYLKNKFYLGGFFLILVVLFFYLAVRLMFALPYILLEDITVKEAVRISWQKTRKPWRYMGRLLTILVEASLPLLLAAFLAPWLQYLADKAPEEISLTVAILQFILLRFVQYLVLSFLMVRIVSLLLEKEMPVYERSRLHHRFRLLILFVTTIVFASQGLAFFLIPYQSLPVTISHRGVDAGNGVQNTIQSLEKTAQLKPDYIEMDIQETKDGQFVMMHDPTLSDLAGVELTTHDLTLAELTQMTISENGVKTKISSFDAYLDKADQLGQKLLIEIKTSKADSSQLMTHFLHKYAKRIKEKGHLIHSLDYEVIAAVKKYDKTIPAYFILPYNSIFLRTLADGYTMEHSSLTSAFMDKAWLNGKAVLAWTVNDDENMEKMITLEAEGIITDNLTELKAVLADRKSDKNYHDLMVRWLIENYSLI